MTDRANLTASASLLLILLLLLCGLANVCHGGVRITFWSNTDFQGEQYNIDMEYGECYRLGVSNDRLSSLSTNGHCVDIYTRNDCFGGMFRMESNSSACHRNFGDCDMNDRVSSVRLCPRCRNSCYSYDGQNTNYEDFNNGDPNMCHCNCNCGNGRGCNNNNNNYNK